MNRVKNSASETYLQSHNYNLPDDRASSNALQQFSLQRSTMPPLLFTLNSIVLFSFILDRLLLFPVNLIIVSIALSDWVIGLVHDVIGGVENVSQQRSFNANACNFYKFGTCLLGFSNNCSNCAGRVPGNLSANESQSFNGRSW